MPLSHVCCAHFYLGSTASSLEFPVGKDGPPSACKESACKCVPASAGQGHPSHWGYQEACVGGPLSPLPKFQAQLASVPYTKPSRISPDPMGSLVSIPGPRAVLSQILLSTHDLLHVAGPLQSPQPPSTKLKCTCSRKPFLDPLCLTQLMLVTSQE